LKREVRSYTHHDVDIRDQAQIFRTFEHYRTAISLVLHTAAQPSHDWAARDPITDFTVNANGTSVMLEATRRFAPEAVFIFMSTNKVYGDSPNRLPLTELGSRWEIEPNHPYAQGIPESMSIDRTLHSLFGASKVAADVLVQEYGRYFGMKTACFRGGCLTGSNHSGAQLHGFLAYLMKWGDGRSVHYLRLQAEAGTRQSPQLRPHSSLRRVLQEPWSGGGLQHGRRPV
jgi:CDP-paratose 2-epimerase